jgi:putative ABC transport system substrate-binding protein
MPVPNFKALVEGFKALGYVDRQNIRLEHRFPNEIPERFKNMAAELVASKVDVLVSVGATAAPYVKNATTMIPVVFSVVSDPVAAKLVDSLARPGGNVTGLTYFAAELAGKRLQLLKDGIPGLSRVGPTCQSEYLSLASLYRRLASRCGQAWTGPSNVRGALPE